jgi:cation-transporting ATPase 13A3/4/5
VALANVGYILSGGLLWILARWFPKLKLQLNYDPCGLSIATHVFVENQWEEGVVIPIRECHFSGKISEAFPKTRNSTYISMLRTFEYRYIRFILSPHTWEFVPNDIWRDSKWESVEVALDGILDSADLARRQTLFKSNNIQIEEKPTVKILIDEVLHPFFLFQVASIILWSIDNYYYYATVIFLISLASILVTLYETKANMRKLRKFSTFSCTMKVWRFGAWMTLDSVDLVPGDVFEVTPGIITHLPADSVLLNGDCIVNESMLTGESIPVSKSPIVDTELQALDFEKEDPASISSMSRYFLFSGTKIIRSRASAGASNVNVFSEGVEAMKSDMRVMGALAMVVRTGFNTTKGNLIRSMLFPKPNKFKFYRDSFRFIGFLGIIAALGFAVSFYNFVLMGLSWGIIFIRALDLITIVVPPALPATMAIGTSFAISRLKKGLIYCISPPRVNICGKLDLMCFDKTGTLTEEGLDVLGFRFTVPLKEATLWPDETFTSAGDGTCRFSRLYSHAEEVVPRLISKSPSRTPSPEPQSFSKLSGLSLKYASIPSHPNAEKEYEYPLIICAMATCHSIKVVDGDLVGDPLDLKMFSFTGWEISENAAVSGEFGHIPLVEPPKTSPHISQEDLVSKIGVVRAFDFVSSLRRMSVIVKRYQLPLNSIQHVIAHSGPTDYEVFVKGAPEVMESICDPKSIPDNYNEQLRYYSHHGYRVIAIGHSILTDMLPSDIQELRRSAAEENIQFLGFIIFENKLKVGTASVVKVLNEANIRQVMVTGIF